VARRDVAAAAVILVGITPLTVREWVEWEVLNTLTLRESDLGRAHAYLLSAVQRAQPHRCLATIIRSRPGIDDLLRSMPTPIAQRDYVDTLLSKANWFLLPSRGVAGQPTDELPPARELDVLRLLSSRLTTHGIADSLFLSRNTIKSHTKGIYLNQRVNSRSDAVRAWQTRSSP
jgi:LuxR family maltose regulon positive regulatory protein